MDSLLDVSAAYPNNGVAFNTSKETTLRELIKIDGIDEEVFKLENMGIALGSSSSLSYCMNMLGFPSLNETLQEFLVDHPDAKLKVSMEEARQDMHGENAELYPVATLI